MTAIGSKVGVETSNGNQRSQALEAQITALQAQTAVLEGKQAEINLLDSAMKAQRLRADRLAAQLRAIRRVEARLERLVKRLRRTR